MLLLQGQGYIPFQASPVLFQGAEAPGNHIETQIQVLLMFLPQTGVLHHLTGVSLMRPLNQGTLHHLKDKARNKPLAVLFYSPEVPHCKAKQQA